RARGWGDVRERWREGAEQPAVRRMRLRHDPFDLLDPQFEPACVVDDSEIVFADKVEAENVLIERAGPGAVGRREEGDQARLIQHAPSLGGLAVKLQSIDDL